MDLRLDHVIRLTAEQRRVRAGDGDRAGIGRLQHWRSVDADQLRLAGLVAHRVKRLPPEIGGSSRTTGSPCFMRSAQSRTVWPTTQPSARAAWH